MHTPDIRMKTKHEHQCVADPALKPICPAARFLPASRTEGESDHHLGISISFIFIGVETKQKGLDLIGQDKAKLTQSPMVVAVELASSHHCWWERASPVGSVQICLFIGDRCQAWQGTNDGACEGLRWDLNRP